ncbi:MULTISPECIES: ribonuclease III [Flammeovirga]|uniref:Ribonuclease 3 n=1 Tax=Flammeovirga agarivorans TaxID=2726742 RepID=A0A7X8SJ69_9BACT|nr:MULTISPECIES: ribonuclease III [Flammeovirga]NLR91211.1 ribonuclease III [Flammeovirga agarivorans]
MILGKIFKRWVSSYNEKEKELDHVVRQITGKKPYNIKLYHLAMQHTSVAFENNSVKGFKESNERLEYLGDAVLGAVVAEYLFKRYPYKDEGFLTEIRSRIVNRESLNRLAVKIGLSQMVAFEGRKNSALSHKSIYGDAMEAFIGAIYLDRGFHFTRRFIIHKLLMRHYDIEELIVTTTNFKSLIIEWAQKNSKAVDFTVSKQGGKDGKQFKVNLTIDGEVQAEGAGYSKKKAEQDAARKTCESLTLI